MGSATAFPDNGNVHSTTTPKVVKDNGLIKNLLHNDKHIQCKITNNIVSIYTNILIRQLPEQSDSHTHDQCILRDARKNLVVVDF